jgi:hypothetical protein
MRDHASDSSPENFGGSPVVDNSSSRVGEKSFSHELSELDLVSEKGSGNVDSLGSDNCNSLT